MSNSRSIQDFEKSKYPLLFISLVFSIMIDPNTVIVALKLVTWSLKAINEVVKLNNLNQKRLSGNKSSSGAISKIDRQLKEAELKYYQGKTKRDRDLLAIEKQKLANDNIRIEIEEARLGIDTDRLKLSKQERQDRLEISRLHRELLKEIQIEESKVKLQSKQIDWDNTRDNWFSKISRAETQSILTKYNHRLLILTSPPEIDPYFDNAQNFQQWSFKQEMRKIDKFLGQYYSSQSAESPVQFYYDYFTGTISKIDVNRLHDLLSSVATYILYSDISDDTVTFWVAHWQTDQSEATHFPPLEWNWRETKDKLVAQGETEAAAILVVKQTIIEIHRLLTAYLADLYYLTIDPFYEPQLFKIFKQEEQPALQPFVESLCEFQVEQRTAYYQELARIEAEHSARQLDQLLNTGKWQEADQETTRLMLKLANREKGWLDFDSCSKFPPEGLQLRIIDQLWLKYSDNRLGFSVQKQIWVELGGKLDGRYNDGGYDYDTFHKLADKVGWKKSEQWLSHENLSFSTSKKGHLPSACLVLGMYDEKMGAAGGVVTSIRFLVYLLSYL